MLAGGPPDFPGESWFLHDLDGMGLDELAMTVRNLGRAVDLLGANERTRWPWVWVVERHQHAQEQLRAEQQARRSCR